jgi:hypothetical protein
MMKVQPGVAVVEEDDNNTTSKIKAKMKKICRENIEF